MIPLVLWLAAPKLRADADAPPTGDARWHDDAGPGVELLHTAEPCAWCDDEGVLWHEGVSGPEPCPRCAR